MLTPTPSEAHVLADQVERAFRGGAWHGPSLTELLDGLGDRIVAARPAPGQNSILGHVEHLAFWFDEIARRIGGRSPESAGREPAWSDEAGDQRARWGEARRGLEEGHRRLREAILGLDGEALARVPPGTETDVRGMVLGSLQHTAYHAGQISLLRRLAEAREGAQP
jgi:hypothetical protein